MTLGDKENAALGATDLARSQAGNPSAVDLAARTLMALGMTSDALNLYARLQMALPDSAQTQLRYGKALVAADRAEDARAAFDRAVAIDQQFMPAWIERIGLEQKMKGPDAAMTVAEKAKAKNPDNPAALALQGDLLLGTGRAGEAADNYRQMLALKPSPLLLLRLCKAKTQEGDGTAAGALMAEWVQKYPGDLDVRLALAGFKLNQGDFAAAAAQYEVAAAKLPRNVAILNNLAWVYGHLNDPRSLEVARQAFVMASESPVIMDTYGYLLYQRGEPQKGGDLVRRSFEANPRDPQTAFHMARLLADGKDGAGAQNILKPLLDSKVVFDGAEEARELYAKLRGS
jgi:predicted Zn-dependent protease